MYLTKPVDVQMLFRAIQQVAKREQAAD